LFLNFIEFSKSIINFIFNIIQHFPQILEEKNVVEYSKEDNSSKFEKRRILTDKGSISEKADQLITEKK
jgi:hypothetical protein